MPETFQVLTDCPDCGVASAVVELIDATRGEGVSVESACRLCGRAERMGTLVQAGRRFVAPIEVIAALDAWAEVEGEPELDRFCASAFGGLPPEELARKVLAGERIETSFDAVAFLFPGLGAGGGAAVDPGESPALRPLPPEALQPVRTYDPFARTAVAARALAAVMLADGEVRPGEVRFLERFLARSGLEPFSQADLRPWRPADLAWPDDPDPIIEAMVRLAHIDRQRDGSEWRVVREFARHWGYPLPRLEALGRRVDRETAPATVKLWRSLKSLIITEHR